MMSAETWQCFHVTISVLKTWVCNMYNYIANITETRELNDFILSVVYSPIISQYLFATDLMRILRARLLSNKILRT